MNDCTPDRARPEDTRFDRLVDGELPPEEYRALINALDHEQGGWRGCALAFLESQALRSELGGWRRSLDAPPLRALPTKPPAPLAGLGLRSWLAMAASVVLAFGLGTALSGVWRPSPQEETAAGNSLGTRDLATGAKGNHANQEGLQHVAFRPVGNVRLVVDGAGGEQTFAEEVPVYEIDQNLAEYMQECQPAIDPGVLQWLEERGHEVEVQLEYVPGRLDDGRPMYVPLEQYKITPVKRSY